MARQVYSHYQRESFLTLSTWYDFFSLKLHDLIVRDDNLIGETFFMLSGWWDKLFHVVWLMGEAVSCFLVDGRSCFMLSGWWDKLFHVFWLMGEAVSCFLTVGTSCFMFSGWWVKLFHVFWLWKARLSWIFVPLRRKQIALQSTPARLRRQTTWRHINNDWPSKSRSQCEFPVLLQGAFKVIN